LIDGDLRNRGLSRKLQDVSGDGLAEALQGEERWSRFVRIDRGTGLAILPALGRHRGHSTDLLAGPDMHKLIEEARQIFAYVVIDLPPMGPVIDAKAFEPMADGFILLAKWGSTPRALLASILRTERKIAMKTIGIILNMADMKKLARYTTQSDAEDYMDRYGSYYRERRT
jgi:succinoglycan biosynthesis transport protein ExoP